MGSLDIILLHFFIILILDYIKVSIKKNSALKQWKTITLETNELLADFIPTL